MTYSIREELPFQSTRPRGARLYQINDQSGNGLFQSTRPRGARPGRCRRTPCRECFNPRAHAGRDFFQNRGAGVELVSIHAPTRGATHVPVRFHAPVVVSIHAPTRGATPQPAASWRQWLVSIHAPTRGATRKQQDEMRVEQFQSTRPRGARLACQPECRRRSSVSIHAPTRGATRRSRLTGGAGAVSIHAPTRGATWRMKRTLYIRPVSIHAPTRGATSAGLAPGGQATVSIHAPTRGATGEESVPASCVFQSTRPRGARHPMHSMSAFLILFQSTRPRGARRGGAGGGAASRAVSIHAPTRGATRWKPEINMRAWFQSTRPRGARPGKIHMLAGKITFQSTRPRGARRLMV